MDAYIGLGSNLGDRQAHLQEALELIAELPDVKVIQTSSVYETAPVGIEKQPDFLNAVAKLQTSLIPLALLHALLDIEKSMGRVRTVRWGPRVIDLDVLLFGDQQIALPELTVPHPRLCERVFVIVPLAEIAPGLVVTGQQKTLKEIAEYFPEDGNIQRAGVVQEGLGVVSRV